MMVFSHIVMMCIYVTCALRIHKGLKLKVYLLLLLSILSKDTGSTCTKGKPARGAPRLVTYIHTQM